MTKIPTTRDDRTARRPNVKVNGASLPAARRLEASAMRCEGMRAHRYRRARRLHRATSGRWVCSGFSPLAGLDRHAPERRVSGADPTGRNDPKPTFSWSALVHCAGRGTWDMTGISPASARQKDFVFAQFGSQDVSATRASSRAAWSKGVCAVAEQRVSHIRPVKLELSRFMLRGSCCRALLRWLR